MTEIKRVNLYDFDKAEIVFSEEEIEFPEKLPLTEDFDSTKRAGWAKNFRTEDGKIVFDAKIEDDKIEFALKEGLPMTAAPAFTENKLTDCSIVLNHENPELNNNLSDNYES